MDTTLLHFKKHIHFKAPRMKEIHADNVNRMKTHILITKARKKMTQLKCLRHIGIHTLFISLFSVETNMLYT